MRCYSLRAICEIIVQHANMYRSLIEPIRRGFCIRTARGVAMKVSMVTRHVRRVAIAVSMVTHRGARHYQSGVHGNATRGPGVDSLSRD